MKVNKSRIVYTHHIMNFKVKCHLLLRLLYVSHLAGALWHEELQTRSSISYINHGEREADRVGGVKVKNAGNSLWELVLLSAQQIVH